MKSKTDKLRKVVEDLPYGSVIKYKHELYFKSEGLEADIVTNSRGMWHFITDYNGHSGIKWYGMIEVMYHPSKQWINQRPT